MMFNRETKALRSRGFQPTTKLKEALQRMVEKASIKQERI